MKYSKALIKYDNTITRKYKGWQITYLIFFLLIIGSIIGFIGGKSFQIGYSMGLVFSGVVLMVNRFIYDKSKEVKK